MPPVEQFTWLKGALALEPNTLIFDVADAPFGFVAVGVQIKLLGPGPSPGPSWNPLSDLYSGVIWTSPDGREWTRVPDGPEFNGARMIRVITAGSTVLVFGLAGVCLPDACSGLPPNGGTIVWSTADGATWQRLADTGLEDGAVVDVAAVDGGLLAVGYVANNGSKPDADPFTDPTDAAVWRSTDGNHWEPIGDLPVADSIGTLAVEATNVLALGSRNYSGVTWTSADSGATWDQGPGISDDWGSVAHAPGGPVVAVALYETDAKLYRSDGVATGPLRSYSPHNTSGFRPVKVAVLGGSFVVFGWTVQQSDFQTIDYDPVSYSSLDGLDWIPAGLPKEWDGQAPRAVARHGDLVVVLLGYMQTFNGPPDDLTMSIWVGSPTSQK